MNLNKLEINANSIPYKIMYASFAFAIALILALPAHAKDGKAWGGKCIHVGSGGATTAVSCGDGASCSGGGWGGGDCTIGMRDTSKTLTPKAKSADPAILKGSAPKQPVKK